MARSDKRPRKQAHAPVVPVAPVVAAQVLDAPESTLLDLLDNLLNKGVMADGDVTLGVAGIDLIYLRLSALLCAADRVLPHHVEAPRKRRSRRRRPALFKQSAS
jgi:hypothetical protein